MVSPLGVVVVIVVVLVGSDCASREAVGGASVSTRDGE